MRAEPVVPPDRLAALRAPFLASGAEAVDAPLLQPLGLLLDLAGEALRARLFVVQAEGGAELCLRPDFTVPVARLHLDRGATSGRYMYEGKVFRAAPEGADLAEEFLQIGLERFDGGGADVAGADAEIVAVAWRAAEAGGRRDLSLWLGDVALFAAFVDGLDLNPSLSARLKRAAARPRLMQAELARAGQTAPGSEDSLAGVLAALSPVEAGRMLEEMWSLAGVEPVGGRGPAEIAQRLVRRAEAARAPALTPDQAEAVRRFLAIEAEPADALAAVAALAGPKAKALKGALKGWTERLARLAEAGVPIAHARFATALGHAFDYYDGLTFEIRSQALGADRPIATGGRYDGLPTRLGGPAEAQAVGCTLRPRWALAEDAQ
jgi:ATP phosphoribosyltransferase regulatory subunit